MEGTATHPPDAIMTTHSRQCVEGSLSNSYSIDESIEGMREVATESFRVLKPDRYYAILMGDPRTKKHHVPTAFRVLQAFLDSGFILKEDIIKHQWRCTSTPFWREINRRQLFTGYARASLCTLQAGRGREN